MRRAYREVLMSVGTVVILLLTLTAFDVRVRDQVSRHLRVPAHMEVASVGHQLRDLTKCDHAGRALSESGACAAPHLRVPVGRAHVVHAANLECPSSSPSNPIADRPRT
jgi:hypothetical protein